MSKILTTKDNKILIDTNKKIYTIEKIGATIKTNGVWQGTKINVGDYVENLYFNTKLSIEEVYKICDSLNLDGTTQYMGLLYCDEKNNMVVVVDYREVFSDGVTILVAIDGFSGYLFNTNKSLEQAEGISSAGWIADIPSDFPYPVNSNVISSFDDGDGFVVKLPDVDTSQLVSTTPFTKTSGEIVELSGEYDGNTIETEVKNFYVGTAVPNTGYVENVYFNINLSVEEVVEILSKINLNFEDNMEGIIYFGDSAIGFAKTITDDPTYLIGDLSFENVYFSSIPEEYGWGIGFYGWKPDFNGEIKINSTVYPNYDIIPIGSQNNKLSSLFSTTPFEMVSGINVKELIENKKIPLNIKVSGGNGGSSGEQERSLKKYLDLTKNCYEMFSFSNNSLFKSEELEDILKYNDTENVANIEYMFYACTSLTSIPLISMKNVRLMSYAFSECESLRELHIEKLVGSSLSPSEHTISYCYELTKVEIDSFEADYIDYCFYECYSLRTLIIREFTKDPSEIYGEEVFEGCYHFDGTQDDDYNPDEDMDGYIYVPRKYINSLSNSEVFSPYADQIRALEDYTVDGTTTGELDENKINE